MATCDKKLRKKTQICIGSMNRKIEIFARSLTPPIDPFTGEFVSTETFTLLANPWAMVETPRGLTIFDDIGIERVVNTVFSTRFIADITSEMWIEYAGNRYDILTVIDYQNNKLFSQFNCALTGDETKEASKA